MNHFWCRAKPFVWGVLCFLLALYFSPLSAQINYASATHDISPFWIRLFPNGAFLLVLPGIIIGIVAPIFVLISLVIARFQREKLTRVVRYIALMWLFNWLIFALYVPPITRHQLKLQRLWPMRRAGLQQAATRAQPLISAIEKFKRDNKRLPANLRELVPAYISAVPKTGMTAYPTFLYQNDGYRKSYFQTYQLSVRTGFGFAFDSFNYWREGNYPSEMYGGRVERIGNWAYVHE